MTENDHLAYRLNREPVGRWIINTIRIIVVPVLFGETLMHVPVAEFIQTVSILSLSEDNQAHTLRPAGADLHPVFFPADDYLALPRLGVIHAVVSKAFTEIVYGLDFDFVPRSHPACRLT